MDISSTPSDQRYEQTHHVKSFAADKDNKSMNEFL